MLNAYSVIIGFARRRTVGPFLEWGASLGRSGDYATLILILVGLGIVLFVALWSDKKN